MKPNRIAVLTLAAVSVLHVTPSIAAPAKKAAKPAAQPGTGTVTRAQMIVEDNKIFDRADTNRDGYMSRVEFAKRMTGVINANHPASKAEAQQMLNAANRAFNNVDTNHDGKLSRAEATARPLKAFDIMDTNHDGILTVAEKRAADETGPALKAGPPQPAPGR